MSNEGFIILGNQLFPLDYIKKYKSCHFFMAEDFELCTYFKFHKHKLIFFLGHTMQKHTFHEFFQEHFLNPYEI